MVTEPLIGLALCLLAVLIGSVIWWRRQFRSRVGVPRAIGLIAIGAFFLLPVLSYSIAGAPPPTTAPEINAATETADELVPDGSEAAPARVEQDEIDQQHGAEAMAQEQEIGPDDAPAIDIVRPEARAALTDAQVESQLSYFRAWRIYTPVSDAIRALGPPDFVHLSSDRGEVGQELRENGIPRTLVWSVHGCAPVRIDVDASGRTIGVDYSSLMNREMFCTPAMVSALTPAPSFSCERPERGPHCR